MYVRQDSAAVCQKGNISAVVNRSGLCLELLLGAVERESPFKCETESRWETKGMAN